MYNNRGYKLRKWDVQDDIARAKDEWRNGNSELALHTLKVAERVANIWHMNSLLEEIWELQSQIMEAAFFLAEAAAKERLDTSC